MPLIFNAGNTKTHFRKEDAMNTDKLIVPNISCGHCVSAIESELSDLDGVTAVRADAETKTVTVGWDAPATMESIRATLDEINYPAQ
jgi:copper chaperone CopZ